MISVNEAKELIQLHCKVLPLKIMRLCDAQGLKLAEDIFASNNFPPFEQSAMDGYAFLFDEWKNQPLTIIGEMQAGSQLEFSISKNEAVRIFTGAPIPTGADTVVMQEKVLVSDDKLTIHDDVLTKGKNVRPQGSEIRKGELGLPAGTNLTAGAIGFIAGLGIPEMLAIPKPRVSIIVTGKELQKPGIALQAGQVYESNSFALAAALGDLGINDVTINYVDDDLDSLQEIIKNTLQAADLILLTGGVSVGDYDFVTRALANNDVETIFHKVKQKPGKPLYLGKKKDTIIFGLPGNPSSVLTCFYEYVTLAIEKMMDVKKPFLQIDQMPVNAGYQKNAGITHFLKGNHNNGIVEILGAQESYKMNSFALANCLVVVGESETEINKGDLVEVHLL